jgi:hypothetical protein
VNWGFSPAYSISSWFSMLIYHPRNEQYARWWQQLRNVISPYRHNGDDDDDDYDDELYAVDAEAASPPGKSLRCAAPREQDAECNTHAVSLASGGQKYPGPCTESNPGRPAYTQSLSSD